MDMRKDSMEGRRSSGNFSLTMLDTDSHAIWKRVQVRKETVAVTEDSGDLEMHV